MFYTQEEVDAKVSEAVTDGVQALHRATANVSTKLRDKAIEWFKGEVRGGSMDKDDALGIFNGLADAIGWATIDTISSTYAVTVSVDDKVIGTFEGVEADDEDDAVAIVTDEIEAEMTIELSYNGTTLSETFSGWDLSIDAEAVEE